MAAALTAIAFALSGCMTSGERAAQMAVQDNATCTQMTGAASGSEPHQACLNRMMSYQAMAEEREYREYQAVQDASRALQNIGR
jgi:hypothetical protein